MLLICERIELDIKHDIHLLTCSLVIRLKSQNKRKDDFQLKNWDKGFI